MTRIYASAQWSADADGMHAKIARPVRSATFVSANRTKELRMSNGTPLAPQAKSMAQATATSIVVGLLLAHLEETTPGTAAALAERLNTVLAHAEARATMDATTLEEVSSHARGLLSTRNT